MSKLRCIVCLVILILLSILPFSSRSAYAQGYPQNGQYQQGSQPQQQGNIQFNTKPIGTLPGSVQSNITYCTINGQNELADVYSPAAKNTPGSNLIIYIHGGGFVGGDRKQAFDWTTPYFTALLQAGYTIASVDYRLAPGAKWPAQIEDVKCAVRYFRSNASVYHINPDLIGAMGDSAGGTLASLLGVDDTSQNWDVGQFPNVSSKVQAVVDMFGLVDWNASDFPVIQNPQFFQGLFNADSQLAAHASAVGYISSSASPFLIQHGAMDAMIPFTQSQSLYTKLQSAGVPVQLQSVTNANHEFIVVNQSQPESPSNDQRAQSVVTFFNTYLTTAKFTKPVTATNLPAMNKVAMINYAKPSEQNKSLLPAVLVILCVLLILSLIAAFFYFRKQKQPTAQETQSTTGEEDGLKQ